MLYTQYVLTKTTDRLWGVHTYATCGYSWYIYSKCTISKVKVLVLHLTDIIYFNHLIVHIDSKISRTNIELWDITKTYRQVALISYIGSLVGCFQTKGLR